MRHIPGEVQAVLKGPSEIDALRARGAKLGSRLGSASKILGMVGGIWFLIERIVG